LGGDQIKAGAMDGACSTHGRDENKYKSLVGKPVEQTASETLAQWASNMTKNSKATCEGVD
jgi:hypothetical protein